MLATEPWEGSATALLCEIISRIVWLRAKSYMETSMYWGLLLGESRNLELSLCVGFKISPMFSRIERAVYLLCVRFSSRLAV